MTRTPPTLIGLATLMMCGVAFGQQAVKLDIEAQPLDRALNSWANQTGYQVLIPVERAARGQIAPSLKGRYTPEGALKVLLASTDLKYEFVNAKTVTIRAAVVQSDSAPPPGGVPAIRERSAPLVLAQSRPRETQAAADIPNDANESRGPTTSRDGVTEVVVTAQKREERLLDVPVPVAAISASSLSASNQLRLQDYYSKIPGVNLLLGTRGEPTVTIRGITTGPGTPTTGITVDDVPYGASTNLGGGYTVPDIDPSDLSRVEVLRGPQGTLYGASSMGGLIKYVTVDPSLSGMTGRLQVGASDVKNGSDVRPSVRGSVSVPMSDTVAVSGSAYLRRDPGYIDNARTGEEGDNDRKGAGGRVAALWRPSDSLSLKVSALYQDNKSMGSSLVYVRPGLGDLQHDTLAGTGEYHTKNQVYGAILNADLGAVDLTSVSGYSINNVAAVTDYSTAFGANATRFFGVTGAPLRDNYELKKFTQEIRASGTAGERIDWLVGGFYTDEKTPWRQAIMAASAATGDEVGTLLLSTWDLNYSEYAAFGDVTFHFTDAIDLQVGGRSSHNRQTYSSVNQGPQVGPTPVVQPELIAKDNPFTYLVTPRWKLTPNLMLYARMASGYRAGGANAPVDAPRSYKADSTRNYEVGFKGDWLDHALTVDSSVYYIDWRDIQISLLAPSALSYIGNAGRAKSQGVELTVEARPLHGMTIATWASWNDAELTESFPSTATIYGASGNRLPFSSKLSGSVSLSQRMSLTQGIVGVASASVSYVGKRLSVFRGLSGGVPLPRQELPAYATTDVSVGAEFGESWTASLFVNNVTDRRGVLQGGQGFRFPFAYEYIQPRTTGLVLTKRF